MKTFRRILTSFVLFLILLTMGFGVIQYYPYIFSRKVHGVILSVDRVQVNISLLQGQNQGSNEGLSPQLFSFAVAIREDSGEIVTASAEDRQWAAAQRGLCAEAVYYPYPPWRVMKAGTFFNARLDRLYECPDKAALLPPRPASPPPPAAVTPPSSAPSGADPASPSRPVTAPPESSSSQPPVSNYY